jgi:hypothetical protein
METISMALGTLSSSGDACSICNVRKHKVVAIFQREGAGVDLLRHRQYKAPVFLALA